MKTLIVLGVIAAAALPVFVILISRMRALQRPGRDGGDVLLTSGSTSDSGGPLFADPDCSDGSSSCDGGGDSGGGGDGGGGGD